MYNNYYYIGYLFLNFYWAIIIILLLLLVLLLLLLLYRILNSWNVFLKWILKRLETDEVCRYKNCMEIELVDTVVISIITYILIQRLSFQVLQFPFPTYFHRCFLTTSIFLFANIILMFVFEPIEIDILTSLKTV